MMNSKWATLHISWKTVFWLLPHLCLWPIASGSCCTCCERQSHHIFSHHQQGVSHVTDCCERQSDSYYDQQGVSDNADICNRQSHSYAQQGVSTNISHPWKAVSWHVTFLWPTDCEWHGILKHSVITYFLWSTACEWHYTFLWKAISFNISFPMVLNGEWVTLHIFVKGNFISSFLMTDRWWGTLPISVKSTLITSFAWPTGCQWHCMFLWKAVLSHLFVQPTASEWCFTFYWRIFNTLHVFLPWPTESVWYCTVLWKAVSHLFLWPTASEWHCTSLWQAISLHLFLQPSSNGSLWV